jgi:hypothetical protein
VRCEMSSQHLERRAAHPADLGEQHDIAIGCGLKQQCTDGSITPADAARHRVFNELQGADPMAVGIFEDAVALVVQLLLVGRYPQIGEGGHVALSEETAISAFLERLWYVSIQIEGVVVVFL